MKNLFTIMLILGCFSLHARDTLIESGHRVLVCSNTEGYDQVQFYDFVEARENSQMDIREEGISKEEYLDRVFAKLEAKHPYLKILLKKEIEHLTSKEVYLEGSEVLPLTSDATTELGFRICPNNMETKAVQIATFNSNLKQFKVDKGLLSRLSELDQAGLLVSAGLYSVLRDWVKKNNGLEARSLTSLLFSDKDISSSPVLESIFKTVFQNAIMEFEMNVLTTWTGKTSQVEADEYLRTATTTLPYGIPYQSSITSESLPPVQVAKLQKINYVVDSLSAKVIAGASTATFFGGLGIGILAQVGGSTAATSVASVIMGVSVGGVVVAGGIVTVVAISVVVKKAKLKRLKNYLLEAYLCQQSNRDCTEEDYDHLRKSHEKFVALDSSHAEVSLNQYVAQILKLARADELMGMNRSGMESYVNLSFPE